MRCRNLAPLALAGVAVLAACDDRGPLEPRAEVSHPAARPRLSAVSGSEAGYAYKCGTGIAPDQVQANAELRRLYDAWKATFVTTRGAGGYRRVAVGDTPWDPEKSDDTFSEGIGYGMLLAAYLDDRALLDDLWAYARLHHNARGLMVWDVNGDGTHPYDPNGVYNAATDGDEDMAFALIVADKKWGGGYRSQALTLLGNLLAHGVGTDNVFRSEDYWHKQGGDVVNPSYLDPGYYKTFGYYTGVDRWHQVAAKSYEILRGINAQGHNAGTGLVPDWSKADGTQARGWNDATGTYDGAPYGYNYDYDATRAPWRLAKDYAWWCEGAAATQLQRMSAFWKGVGAASIVDGYTQGGAVLNKGYTPGHNLTFVSTAMTAALGPTDAAHRTAMWNETVGLQEVSYFGSSLRLLALLIASGNMPNPLSRAVDTFEDGNTGGWNTFAGGGSTITISAVSPGVFNSNAALRVDYSIAPGGWVGAQVSYWYAAQNWSGFTSIGFRVYGTGLGNTLRFTIYDNGPTADASERYDYSFPDNFTGWKHFSVPWSSFTRAGWQPAGAPSDGLTLSQVWGFSIAPVNPGSGSFRVDQIELYR